jgi:PTS system fructose-specific IIC component
MAKKSTWNTLKSYALTGISFLIPIVVAGGFTMAIGSIFGGETVDSLIGETNFANILYTVGGIVLGMLPAVIGTGIAFAIAGKPGIAPGLVTGLISSQIGAGFLGAFIGGYLAGWIAKALVDHMNVPGWAEGLKPMLLIPLISSLAMILVMQYILGYPISMFMNALDSFIRGLDMSQKVIFGVVVGILSGVDYGGPINKVVYAFMLTLQSEGIYQPMAVLFLASMVTPFGFTFAYFLQKVFHKNIYTKDDKECLKTAFPMGICMITEGTFPIIFTAFPKAMISTACGAAVGGALSMAWDCGVMVAHGGLFAMPAMQNPFGWLLALLIGSAITGVIWIALVKPIDENAVRTEDESDEEDIDLDAIKVS